MSESMLVHSIMQELGKSGAVFRCNAGTFYTRSGQRVSGLPAGFSDILYVGSDGVACFIETKIAPNKPSPEQSAFIEKMQKLGCRAGVAFSVNDALKICGLNQERN